MNQIREYNFGFNCGISPVVPWGDHHRHNEVEITFADKGAFNLELQGQRIEVKPGKLLIFWGGMPHYIDSLEPNQTQYWMCVPVSSFIQWIDNPQLFRDIFTHGLILTDIYRHLNAYSSLFYLWSAELNDTSQRVRKAAQLSICAQIRCTLEDISKTTGNDGTPNFKETYYSTTTVKSTKLYKRACEYIIDNYTDFDLDADTIAGAINAHPKYLLTLFKRKYGMSLNNFILFLRVSEAQKMLMHTNRKVADIAFECGFSTLSSFYAAFRKIVGEKPLHYRPHRYFPSGP
ncbi:helix-turn-helix domain-containing protein [Marispirochaeta sp.]|jgi:AraC family transcriptional regulator, melibiose operon regulatory protein|uniref:helix-turn-helix domain-containing protein n=1 Tax=Marispirochaeta sp. TaxID=2038653 RepID=UPI0029C68E73|nr:helix-turn-helix domain-containing protein [Marispirochaeta sp.]